MSNQNYVEEKLGEDDTIASLNEFLSRLGNRLEMKCSAN